jgi:integrase
VGTFGAHNLSSLTRNQLQAFCDDRKHLSYSMVDHLRWDLKQILDLAIAEGVITKSPAYVPPGTMLLFVPHECRKAKRLVMGVEQARQAFAALELRERLIVKLAVLAGMRCSEIFGLKRGRIKGNHLEIVERVSKRDVDKPKTQKAERQAALSSYFSSQK